MRINDKWLLKVTEPVWNDLASADCNPDIIPLCLCDACELGFNRGFASGVAIATIIGLSTYATVKITKFWHEKNET